VGGRNGGGTGPGGGGFAFSTGEVGVSGTKFGNSGMAGVLDTDGAIMGPRSMLYLRSSATPGEKLKLNCS